MSKKNFFYLFVGAIILIVLGLIGLALFKKAPVAPVAPSKAPSVELPPVVKKEVPKPVEIPPVIKQTQPQIPAMAVEGKVIFGFEEKVPSWEIPDWCFEKDDYAGESFAVSSKFFKEGKSSLEVMTDFPGAKWTAAYVEIQEYFDWTPYKKISADIFLPKEAPLGLQAKIILTVGEDWAWTEMTRLVKLMPGEWTTVSASLVSGSADWRRTEVTDGFRADVRKLGIRIESNLRPVYSGPIYIDNVRLE